MVSRLILKQLAPVALSRRNKYTNVKLGLSCLNVIFLNIFCINLCSNVLSYSGNELLGLVLTDHKVYILYGLYNSLFDQLIKPKSRNI